MKRISPILEKAENETQIERLADWIRSHVLVIPSDHSLYGPEAVVDMAIALCRQTLGLDAEDLEKP